MIKTVRFALFTTIGILSTFVAATAIIVNVVSFITGGMVSSLLNIAGAIALNVSLWTDYKTTDLSDPESVARHTSLKVWFFLVIVGMLMLVVAASGKGRMTW